jgi:hypothetical protein
MNSWKSTKSITIQNTSSVASFLKILLAFWVVDVLHEEAEVMTTFLHSGRVILKILEKDANYIL